MSIKENILNQKDEILAFAERFGLTNIRLFGSVARGEDGPDSDIDFLVDSKLPITDSFGFIDFQENVSALLDGRHVDIVFSRGLFPPMREAILREAIPL